MDALDQILERIKKNRENAKAAGIPEPQYKCNLCKDTEFILTRNPRGADYAKPCVCTEQKRALRLMANSGIRPEDTKRGFEDFNTFSENGLVNAKQIAARYCKHFTEIKDSRHNSLLLCGASGRGKTTLGMAVANNLIRDCVGVRYMPYRDEVTKLKQIITDEYAYNEQMHRLKTAKLLFIDDMLKGKTTDSDINIMYEIINYRYLERLPMIISTEKLPNELLDFDEAIGSRVMEMCKGYVVTFDSSIPNYRMR
jgi:DNA replication protein DnaC